MQPIIRGSGFGNVSHVLGPWTDYFPSSGGVGLPSSQFGVCLGTRIVGGAKGATISAITVESPFNIAGSAAGLNWRVIVVRGDLPPSIPAVGNKWQHAVNGWPSTGDSDQESEVLWSIMLPAQNTVNNKAFTSPNQWDFPDLCGPSCGPGETMTVFLIPMFNETGVPGYGANNSTFVSMTVNGVYDRRLGSSDDKDTVARSIPAGRLG